MTARATFRQSNESEVRAALQAKLAEHGAASALARELGVSRAYVSMVQTGKAPISQRLAELLGFRRVVLWEKLT